MQHAGHAEVLHVAEPARHLVGNVEAGHRLADELVILRVLFLRRRFGIELDGKTLAADKLGIGDLLAAAGNDAVGDGELRGRHAELFCRGVEECRACRRRGLAQLHAADLNGQAAPGLALVGREQGVALDHVDAVHRHVELVGDDLLQRRIDAGAQLDLAGIDRHLAAVVDRQEGIDLGEDDRLGAGLRHGSLKSAGKREADDQRAGTDERVAAGNLHIHGRLPYAAADARLTARTMRAWVPQRHRLLASAVLMSASLGFLFLVSKSAPCMIMPLMQ